MSYVVDGDPFALTNGEGEVKDTNGDHHPRSKLIAKVKSKMLMVIPHPQFDGEGGVEDVNGDPPLQIDGEGKVKDVNGDPPTPN
jgi:hypothetical protein